MSPVKKFSACDVLLAIQEVSADLRNHLFESTRPNEDQIGLWMDKLAWVSGAAGGLIIACEDIAEEGPTSEHLDTMKRLLAYTQGLQEYCPRARRR